MTISRDEGDTELNTATRLGDLNLAREALREGCDVNAVGRYGWTPLHEAASVGNRDLTLLLLNAGADPSLQDAFQKCTPLHLAAENGKLAVVKLLVKNGAKLNLRNAERKTPIDVAERECKCFLQSKRMENFVKTSNSNKYSNIQQMYGEPRVNTIRQTENLTQAVNTSWKSADSRESVTDSIGWNEQNPGDIKLWFEYNSDAYLLKIAVWEVRDLRVPFDHKYSHLYVKCYLLPDKNKTSKRKTSLKKLGSLNSESRASSSSSSGCSTVSEESDGGLGRSFAGRVKASLSKRPHLHKKRNSDKVKCMVQHQEGDDFGRITTPIQEAFVYDALALSKVNMDTATVQLTVCGRNRRTTQAVPIASLSLSLAASLKVTLAEYFPLEYKVGLPKPPNSLEESFNASVSSKSDGLVQGSAWGQPILSMSMPAVPTTEKAAGPSNTPSSSVTAGRFKLFKKEKKLLNRTPNYRYKNQSSENLTNLLSDHVSSPGQHDKMYQSRMDGTPAHNVQFRNSDLFMATVYRQSSSMQQLDTTSSSISGQIHRPPQQLIYSRALMNDKKKALNTNDVVVEDFDQCDAGIDTPVHLQKSYVTKRNSSMLAF